MSTVFCILVLCGAEEQPVSATRDTLADAIVTLCEREIQRRETLRAELLQTARRRIPAEEKKAKVQQLRRNLDAMRSIDPAKQLPAIHVEAPRVGQVGQLTSIYPRQVAHVVQVVGDSGALIEVAKVILFASGIDTTSLTDASRLDIRGCWEVSGKRSYTSVIGAQRTVFEVRKYDAGHAIAAARERLGDRLNDAAKPKAATRTR